MSAGDHHIQHDNLSGVNPNNEYATNEHGMVWHVADDATEGMTVTTSSTTSFTGTSFTGMPVGSAGQVLGWQQNQHAWVTPEPVTFECIVCDTETEAMICELCKTAVKLMVKKVIEDDIRDELEDLGVSVTVAREKEEG